MKPSGVDGAASGQDFHGQVRGVQRRLAGDPETMAAIERLGSDPQVQAVLNDPAIMQAIASGDLEALMANDTFRQLMSNPSIRAIVGEVGGR